ncbi:MAG: sugar ABC transporter permease [Amaricoccus sp.]
MTATIAPALEAERPSLAERIDRHSGPMMVLPAVIVLLCFAIFPLIISAYLSLSRFALAQGGFTLKFVGFLNFKKLLTGSQQYHLLGTFGPLGPVSWLVLAAGVAVVLLGFARYFLRGRPTVMGTIGRLVTASTALFLLWITVLTFAPGGVPGTVVNTLVYVVVGVSAQFALGLGLALLCGRPIVARNFFRVLFFVPLMVTPVGIAYTFRMLADMQKGPFAPILRAFGVTEWSWATEAWSARLMVLVGDTWQWTPLIFIVMLAAVENQPTDQVEAARLDGASGWQIFRDITWPAIAPVAATVVLIRLIEAFKIIDLPNVLTGGGPGLATESMTLHSFIAWRTQDLGGSAAVGYMLLFISTVVCVSFFNFVVRHTRRFEA